MFSWLKSLFSKPNIVEDTFDEDDIYKPKDRLIYKYFDGQKVVSADPMELYRAYCDIATDLEKDLKVANSPSKDAKEHYLKAIQKIRNIFDVKPLKEGGLTETETMTRFNEFMGFCEVVKKNSKNPAILREEISRNTKSSEEKIPPTSSGSDSGSTGEDKSTGKST